MKQKNHPKQIKSESNEWFIKGDNENPKKDFPTVQKHDVLAYFPHL